MFCVLLKFVINTERENKLFIIEKSGGGSGGVSEVQPLRHVDAVRRRDFSAFMTVIKHLRRHNENRTESGTGTGPEDQDQDCRECQTPCYRAESTGGLDETGGLEDGVDAAVQLHLSVHAAHCSLLGSDHSHLHLPVIDQRVQDGLDVIHGQVHLLQ